MAEFKGVPWRVEIDEPDYLDGIQSGVTVHAIGGRPVAYAFDADEGRVIAAAPSLLEVLKEVEDLSTTIRFSVRQATTSANSVHVGQVLERVRAAISLATGGDAE